MNSLTQKKLDYLAATKEAIRKAIVAKGVSVGYTDSFRSYADKIAEIVVRGDTYEQDILPLTTLEGFASTGNEMMLQTTADYTLTIGETYFITWDGATYECVGQDASAVVPGGVGLGDLSGLGGTGNDEPFTIGVAPGVAMYATQDMDKTSHTIRIYQVVSGFGEGVDPYYRELAEALMTRNVEYLTGGDKTTMIMKGFKLSDGNTLGTLADYSFAGFSDVENMAFTDVVMIRENAFAGDGKLKILDFTVSEVLPQIVMYSGALNGCTALEAYIVRDGAAGLESCSISTANDINGTFYIYVPAAYYDQVTANLGSGYISKERYRKLEDYPAIDRWNETYTVRFWDGDTLVSTKTVKSGQTASAGYSKSGYTLVGWTPEPVNVTEDMDCYGTWVPTEFADATWAEIDALAQTGELSRIYKVGATKPVTLTYADGSSETIDFRIVGMGVDQKPDGTYAPLTLMADGLVKDSLQPASAYNKGNCEFYRMDNVKARMALLYEAMPDDLKAVIKTVVKYANDYRSYEQQIFIPSKMNLTGTEGSVDSDYNAAVFNSDLLPQTQYAYFANGGSIARSKLASASEDSYWTSSCRGYSSASYITAYFYAVDAGTILGSKEGAAAKSHGVCPCFCI